MRITSLVLSILLSFSPSAITPAFAHGAGHGDQQAAVEINKSQAESIAGFYLARKVRDGVLGQSWASVGPSSAQKKIVGYETQWVVTYGNPQASNPAGDNYSIMLSLTGEFLAGDFVEY